jgi:hypothetical protein
MNARDDQKTAYLLWKRRQSDVDREAKRSECMKEIHHLELATKHPMYKVPGPNLLFATTSTTKRLDLNSLLTQISLSSVGTRVLTKSKKFANTRVLIKIYFGQHELRVFTISGSILACIHLIDWESINSIVRGVSEQQDKT